MFNEHEVVARTLKGDLKAFELLVNQYEKLVFSIIKRLISNREDIEDVCQEVFIKVHRNLGSFAFKSKLSTWIARIAYLTSLNHLKKYKNRPVAQHTEDLDDFHFTNETPEELAQKKNISTYIRHLIDEMPEQYKIVLTLYHLNDFSYLEIEAATGMPSGTVRANLFRARRILKEKIEQYLKKETT